MKRKVIRTLSMLLTSVLISGMCVTASAALEIQNVKYNILDFDAKPASLSTPYNKDDGIFVVTKTGGDKVPDGAKIVEENDNKYLDYVNGGEDTYIVFGGTDGTDTSHSITERARFGFDFMLPKTDCTTEQYGRAAYVYLGRRSDTNQTDTVNGNELKLGFTIVYTSNADKFDVRCMKHDAQTGESGNIETGVQYSTDKWYRFEMAVNVPDKEITYLIVDNETETTVFEQTEKFPNEIDGFNNRYSIVPWNRSGLHLCFDNLYSIWGDTPQEIGNVSYGTSSVVAPITLSTDFSESFVQNLENEVRTVANSDYYAAYNTIAFRNVGTTDLRAKITNGSNGFGIYGNITNNPNDMYLQIPGQSSNVDMLLFNQKPGGLVYGKAIYDFDMKFNSTAVSNGSWMKFGADRSNGDANIDLGFVARYRSGTTPVELHCYGSNGETDIKNLETEKWYHFKMEYDAAANKADYYVFDIKSGDVLASAKNVAISNNKQTLSFHLFALNQWGCSIDNYKVSKDTYMIDKSETTVSETDGYYISTIKVANTGYKGTAKVEGEAINATISGPMCEVSENSPTYIVATYDEQGNMIDIATAQQDLSALSNATDTPVLTELTCKIKKTGKEKTIKGFVWNSLEEPMPYIESIELK